MELTARVAVLESPLANHFMAQEPTQRADGRTADDGLLERDVEIRTTLLNENDVLSVRLDRGEGVAVAINRPKGLDFATQRWPAKAFAQFVDAVVGQSRRKLHNRILAVGLFRSLEHLDKKTVVVFGKKV